MTDLSARLRDVLSDELLNTAATVQKELACADPHYEAQREVLMAALLPAWSSLLEEREREIREALAYFMAATESQIACPFCTAESDEQHGDSCPALRADEALSRLASSSSPAAPQEQK